MIYRLEPDGRLTKIHPAVAEAENLMYSLYGGGKVGFDNPVRALGALDKNNHLRGQRKAVKEVKVLNVVW